MATSYLTSELRLANRQRAELAVECIHTEREASTIVILVAIGLTLANAFVWLAVLAGSCA